MKKDMELREVNFSAFSYRQNDCDYHSHRYFELVYVTEGEASHHIENVNVSKIKEGNYFFINPSDRHKYQMTKSPHIGIVNVLFRPDFIVPSMKDCSDFSDIINNYILRSGKINYAEIPTHCIFKDADGSVKKLVTDILSEYNAESPGYLELIRCNLVEIIIRTMRTIIDSKINIADDIISRVISYAEENFSLGAELSEISNQLGLTPQYLSSKFSKVCGMTFTDYLKKLRINHACKLLISTSAKINVIASNVGYNDIKTFNKTFKELTGTNPRNFRKINKAT